MINVPRFIYDYLSIPALLLLIPFILSALHHAKERTWEDILDAIQREVSLDRPKWISLMITITLWSAIFPLVLLFCGYRPAGEILETIPLICFAGITFSFAIRLVRGAEEWGQAL